MPEIIKIDAEQVATLLAQQHINKDRSAIQLQESILEWDEENEEWIYAPEVQSEFNDLYEMYYEILTYNQIKEGRLGHVLYKKEKDR